MKRHLCRVGAASVITLAWGVLSIAAPAAKAMATERAEAEAASLVRQALQAEMAGDAQRCEGLLAKALAIDSESAAARWQAGFVRMDDQWLSIDEVQRRWSADERLAEYRRLRSVRAGTAAGESSLARWCRGQDLDVEARIHWLRLLLFQPWHEEALKNLGMRWYKGELLTAEQIRNRLEGRRSDAGYDDASQMPDLFNGRPPRESWSRHWRPLIANWRRAIDSGTPDVDSSVRDAVIAVGSDEGIEALDKMIWQACSLKREQEAYVALSRKLVKTLDATAEPWAMHSLIRHAVLHPQPEIRKAAAEALKQRPLEDVVPLLLAGMRSPVEASFVILTHPDGSITYQHSFFREGDEADFRSTRSESTHLAPRARWSPKLDAYVFPTQTQIASASMAAYGQAAAKAAAIQGPAEAAAARDREFNRRIGEALGGVTGVDVAPTRKDWHAWWEDYCQDYYELAPARQPTKTRTHQAYSYGARTLSIKPMGFPSCFPRGTPVWTLTGPAGIETIRPGDRVLAQHPVTGELAYRPVLQTTARDPSPMIKVGLGSETIAATRGHPFWVAGDGWQMAKQLDAGLSLHGLTGAVPIASVEEAPPAKAWYDFSYNLIVDDFHTYFVGQSRVLVHDNRLYVQDQVANPLPGLAKP